MSEGLDTEFVVCADADPVLVKIKGKANYLNCSPMNEFFDHILQGNAVSFVIDFENCKGMDSTFLGVLAGVATKTMRNSPQGEVLLVNLNDQNKQLIRGLGLHHLPTVRIENDLEVKEFKNGKSVDLNSGIPGKEASPEVILEAHERLMKLNQANERRFQDVVKFLRREAEKS